MGTWWAKILVGAFFVGFAWWTYGDYARRAAGEGQPNLVEFKMLEGLFESFGPWGPTSFFLVVGVGFLLVGVVQFRTWQQVRSGSRPPNTP